jgi:hypothetical protein
LGFLPWRLAITGRVWVAFALTVIAWPRDIAN